MSNRYKIYREAAVEVLGGLLSPEAFAEAYFIVEKAMGEMPEGSATDEFLQTQIGLALVLAGEKPPKRFVEKLMARCEPYLRDCNQADVRWYLAEAKRGTLMPQTEEELMRNNPSQKIGRVFMAAIAARIENCTAH